MSLLLDIGLDSLGIYDPKQRQTITDAIPIAAKLVDHVNDNLPLFATLSADIQILVPAAKILLDALAAKQRSV